MDNVVAVPGEVASQLGLSSGIRQPTRSFQHLIAPTSNASHLIKLSGQSTLRCILLTLFSSSTLDLKRQVGSLLAYVT